jgi:outer membrane lipoprotein-sorting protein
MKLAVRGLALSLVLLQPLLHAAEIANADTLIRAMHDHYAKSWYETLTFTQKSTTYNPDGTTKVETWYEAALLPGKLRIDIGPPADGKAYLLVDGNVTVFQQGKEVRSRALVNMLLVLGFDVYRQPPEVTLHTIAAEKYDLSKFHEESWQGRTVYVVGAEKGDLKSPQFWVDKERLLFVRLFRPTEADASNMEDIRFVDYRPLEGGWIAARVEVWNEDKLVFSEDYSDIKANPKLDAALFDPKQFNPEHRP